MRCAFTLIELLIVIVIIAVLSGLVILGLGNVLHQARVQGSVAKIVQAISLSKELAASNRRVYSIQINSARGVGTGTDQVDITARDSVVGPRFKHGLNTATAPGSPAALWSDRPEDQWFAIMGPWQDGAGKWYQTRGSFTSNSNGRTYQLFRFSSTKHRAGPNGGAFGPSVPTPTTPIGGASAIYQFDSSLEQVLPPVDWPSSWSWDPFGVQVGPRRFLERGTRWVTRFDSPEWDAVATGSPKWAADYTMGFVNAVSAPYSLNDNSLMGNLNVYPDGTIDTGFCPNANAWTRCGRTAHTSAGKTQFFVGICSNITKKATFTGPSGTTMTYQRPVVMRWITIYMNGLVATGEAPRVGL